MSLLHCQFLKGRTRLVMVEDNDAVIKMLKKSRPPTMAHVSRTHRVNFDWLLERSFDDPAVYCRYIDTKQQLADILTKPHFSARDWCHLCEGFRIGIVGSEQRISGEPKVPVSNPSAQAPISNSSVSAGSLSDSTSFDDIRVNDALIHEEDFPGDPQLLRRHSLILTDELSKLREKADKFDKLCKIRTDSSWIKR